MRAFPVLSRSLRVVVAAALFGAASFACSGSNSPAPATPGAAADGPPGAAPALSHEVVGKEDCLSCHVVGAKKPLGMAESHKGRDNAICRGCHLPAAPKASG
jgi:hypothetical protein